MICKHFATLFLLGFLSISSVSFSATNIDPVFKYSWGPNFGWVNWAGNTANGAFFFNVASGYIWSANVGWIHLGDGTPNNGIAYSNATVNDYGVNVDRLSSPTYYYLSGYAYGANIGWINFNVLDQVGFGNRPRIEKSTGRLLGYAWSANLGWLPLNSEPFSKVVIKYSTSVNSWPRYQ